MPYSKLYILTELSVNDVKFISVDRQKLDLSKYIHLWYRKFYICRDTARFYEHKKMTLVFMGFIRIGLHPLKINQKDKKVCDLAQKHSTSRNWTSIKYLLE